MIDIIYKENGTYQTIEFNNKQELMGWLCETEKGADFEVVMTTCDPSRNSTPWWPKGSDHYE